MRYSNRRVSLAALSFTAMAFAALLGLGAPVHAQTVHVGEIGNLGDAPMYIGIDEGYFAAQHVDVSLERFNGGVQMTAPLSTDELQVAGGGMGAALFNAFARDWPVRIVGARLRDVKGYAANGLVTRPENAAKFKSLKERRSSSRSRI